MYQIKKLMKSRKWKRISERQKSNLLHNDNGSKAKHGPILEMTTTVVIC